MRNYNRSKDFSNKDKNVDKDSKKSKKSALEAAYAYLASRMRTKAEVERQLESKGYEEAEITEALNELIGMRYLDDYQYALRYFEYNREKRRGTLRAVRELEEKGVDSETVSLAREDFIYENKVDEFADALSIAMRELSLRNTSELGDRSFGEMNERLAGSIARKLESKGFPAEVIYRVLDRMRTVDRIELS